jgi:hypothetical protein
MMDNINAAAALYVPVISTIEYGHRLHFYEQKLVEGGYVLKECTLASTLQSSMGLAVSRQPIDPNHVFTFSPGKRDVLCLEDIERDLAISWPEAYWFLIDNAKELLYKLADM